MKRTIHSFIQGSPEWLAYRATPNQFNASDAPAMLGESPYKSRDQLLHEIATGIVPEISAATQQIFNDGHRFESEDRPRAEEFIGQELYPATVSIDLGDFKLSASLDGWTMCEEIIYEHKTKNKTIIEHAARNEIALVHRIQMEQQFICSGATKCLFTGSLGANDDEPVRIWYESDPVLRDRVIAGWKQFAIDLANYIAPEVMAEPVAEEVEMLPSIDIRANGQISVIHNLDVFEKKLSIFLSEKLIRKPQNDNDFATLDLQIKAMKDAEEKLKAAGSSILAQIQAVDTAMTKKNSLHELVRQNRIMAEKLLDAEKAARKTEIINTAKQAFADHIAVCNKGLADSGSAVRMPEVPTDFIGAAKNKRTLDSLRSACNDELARAKIEANRLLNHIDQNLELLRKIAANHKFLFVDIQQLVLKDKDALEAIAKQRIAEHDAAEKKRIEAEAQRIADERAEEERKQALAAEEKLTQPREQEAHEVQNTAAEYEQTYQAPANSTPALSTVPAHRAVDLDLPEPIADMSEFIGGKHAAFKIALDRFLECKKSGADFEQVLRSLIHATQPVHKAA